MKQVIEITRGNLDATAKGLAASVNQMGFRKDGKEMVTSQAIQILAARKGLSIDAFVLQLKQPEQPAPEDQALSALGSLVGYLTRNYGDDHWDATTRDLLDAAVVVLGQPAINWSLETEENAPAVPAAEHSVETAKALVLGKLGYSFAPDIDQPGLWVWTHGNGGCDSSFPSLDEALSDVWWCVSTDVMAAHNLSDQAWEQMGVQQQLALIEKTLAGPAAQVDASKAYTERSFELGAMGRDDLLAVLEAGDYPGQVYDWSADDIRSVILEAEFPGSTDPVAANPDEEHCSECGASNDDGEGWDGKCGACADREFREESLTEEAQALGINLADVKFWVQRHFGKALLDATEYQQEEWLHAYRQYNGLTPEGSVEVSSADKGNARQAADAAFEAYDFGEHLVVADHEGWEWSSGDTLMTKTVFLEDLRKPEEPSKLVKFIVNVENDVVTDIRVSS